MSKYAVILGYGLFDESNALYKSYLDTAIEHANNDSDSVIVFAGGKTNPKHPSDSEAGTMYKYAKPLLKEHVRVLLEEESMTTPQNIEFVSKLIPQAISDPSTNKIEVFCDNIRMVKVMWFVQHYWFKRNMDAIAQFFVDYGYQFYQKQHTTEQIGDHLRNGLEYENVSIVPCWIHTRINSAISQQIGSVLEIQALYDGVLEKKLMRNVLEKFGFKTPK